MITIETINSLSLVLCSLISGLLLGIFYEISNYRRDIKETKDFVDAARNEIREHGKVTLDKIGELQQKVEHLDMYINSNPRR